ncbi:MAG: sulfite exporter TauE/SafE family protein [Burkholderiales bacterium]
MSTSLIAAGLLMGMASTPHCALMCGAPCAAIARRCGGERSGRALAGWHVGRAAAYIVAGAVAASAVALIATWSAGSAFVRPLWTMLQSAVLVLGLALMFSGRTPRWVDAAALGLKRAVPVQGPLAARRSKGMQRATLMGLAWVAMPCGVLYGALAVAALAASPLEGAGVMAAFALGSAPGLAETKVASPKTAAGDCPDPATIVRKLQSRYDETGAFKSKFRQEMKVASLGVSDESEGTVVFKKPGKMRWDFAAPHAQQIVSDGATLWIYQPDDQQVLKAPFTGAFVSSTPVSFLLGVGRITDKFEPHVDVRGCTATRLYVGLAAKNGEDVGALAFGVDRASFDIVEASVTDPLGNVTTLTFSDIVRNVEIPATTFEFQVPAGADVITPPGVAAPPPP